MGRVAVIFLLPNNLRLVRLIISGHVRLRKTWEDIVRSLGSELIFRECNAGTWMPDGAEEAGILLTYVLFPGSFLLGSSVMSL